MKVVRDEAVAAENFTETMDWWACLICGDSRIPEYEMDDHLLYVHNLEWIRNDEDAQVSVWSQKHRVLR